MVSLCFVGSTENSSKTVRCYICGEEFGSHFITVHERQCKRKWDSGITSNGDLRKGASLGHIPAMRETEKGQQRCTINKNNIRKAQSAVNVAQHIPKQAWNARLRGKESDETVSKEATRKRPMRKERPKSAYVKSASTQNLDHDVFGKEFFIYDDSADSNRFGGLSNEKATSMQDLASNTSKDEEPKSRTPKFIECHYCFKMFSIHSIAIHEKKCLCRGDLPNKCTKTRPQRKSLQNARCVSVNELHAGNGSESIENQLNSLLTVSLDDVHSQQPFVNSDSTRFLLCSYCSKPFGSKSLPIHLPQCQMKHAREHGVEGIGISARKSPAYRSNTGSLSKSSVSKQTANSAAVPSALDTSLSERTPLKNSSKRSFAATRKGGASTIPRSGTSNTHNKSTPNGHRITGSVPRSSSSAYVACRYCNNYYGSASVKIHETKCSAKLTKQDDEKRRVKPPRRQLGRLFGFDR